MPRVQAIVHKDDRILMVKHRQGDLEWWCLPGGALLKGEDPADGALRELQEECCVDGRVIRLTSHVCYSDEDETLSFLVDIGEQEPSLGHDPDVSTDRQVLAEVR